MSHRTTHELPLRRAHDGAVDFEAMVQQVKARVRNGRLVLDEPTDLPEGSEVTLSIVEEDDGGDYDDEERERINESIAVSFEQARKGQLIDADVVLARLRARR